MTDDQAAREAAEANAKFRAMFEQGTQFAGILAKDGRVMEANRLCLDACGFTREDVIGKPFWDCGWWHRSPAMVTLVRDATLRAAEGHLTRTETPYFVADGSERFVDLVIAPVTDDAGHVIFIAATGTDITDRKRAEDERTRAEERLKLLDELGEATRTAADPFAVMAATTRLLAGHLHATRCAYADVDADNDRFTIRNDWVEAGAATSAGVYALDRFGKRAATAMRAGRTLVVDDVNRELTAEDGAAMFGAIGVQAIICCPLVKEGRLVAMMAVHHASPRHWTAQDVALVEQAVDRSWAHIERVRADEELREHDRRKDEFLATLAHELRNPLAPIRTGLEVLTQSPSESTAGSALEMMNRQLGHMVRLVDDLLDISRIRSGKVELRCEPIDVRTVLQHAVEASRPLVDVWGHHLVVHAPAEALWVDGDLTRLAQVVSNLLNNSAKYTPRGGRIELSAACEGDEAVIRVIDDGTGIAAAKLPAVFDLFSQLNRTLERSQGGLGIGLWLVRNLVSMHGGTAVAESRGVGLGSTFTVRLPLDRSRPRAPAAPAATPHAPERPAGRRILVVDDNVDAADMLATMLGLTGHEARTANDGEEAVATARELVPDVVFLDIGLPDIDGYEVARRIRADPSLAGTLLIALTGWGSAEDKRRTTDAGFDFHLTKPVDSAVVARLLAQLPRLPP